MAICAVGAQVRQDKGGGHRFLSYSLASCATALWLPKGGRAKANAAEDGTSLLDEAQIGTRWDDIFFQEF